MNCDFDIAVKFFEQEAKEGVVRTAGIATNPGKVIYMSGGLVAQTAYQMAKLYINKMEDVHQEESIENLCKLMQKIFTKETFENMILEEDCEVIVEPLED